MSEIVSRFGGLGQRVNSTVTGNTSTKLVSEPAMARRAITITNNSGDYALWIIPVPKDAVAPTITEATAVFLVTASSTITIQVQGGVDFYGMNSSTDATTSSYTAQEWF